MRKIVPQNKEDYYDPKDNWKVFGRRFLIALIICAIGGVAIWKIWFSS